MKIKRIILLISALLFFNGVISQAQISEGGTPTSFSLEINTNEIPTISMPPFNLDSVKQAEADLGSTPRPFRFGYAFNVDIDLKRFGTKIQLSEGGNL